MFRDKSRYHQDPEQIVKSKSKFADPFKWTEGKKIFTCSWSDWFIPEADQWRNEAWEIIRRSPQHTFQILTKRPERILECLPEWFNEVAHRVWIGVSIESTAFISRANHLMNLPCTTFISFEPLLGPIDWNDSFSMVDWIIVGGESGNDSGKWKYRRCKIEWFQNIIDGCIKYNVPVFVKQIGTYLSKELQLVSDRHGNNISNFPDALRIRSFPQ